MRRRGGQRQREVSDRASGKLWMKREESKLYVEP